MNVKAWKLIYCWKSLNYRRAFIVGTDLDVFVHYNDSLGKTVTPVIGKLFCFSNKEDVKNYLEKYYCSDFNNAHIKILYGTAFNIGYPKIIATYVNDFLRFWESKNKKKKITVHTNRIPVGTISCSAFKVEKIYGKDFKLLETI